MTIKKKKIAHAWLREYHLHDDSKHRVGCMVAQRISPTKARLAFSLCAPGDKMDIKKAKRLAMRRLTEYKTKSIVIDISNGLQAWDETLNIVQTIDKHYDLGRVYAEQRNEDALRGLLSEVCPKA